MDSSDLQVDAGASGSLSTAELMEQHLPLVRILAAKLYRLRWDDSVRFDEFYQMGAVGLAEAAQRYDPSRGAQFSTFASRRITGAILNGLERCTEHHQQLAARRGLIQERIAGWSGERTGEADTLEAALARLSNAAIGLAIGFMLEGTGMYSAGDESSPTDGYRRLATAQLMQRVRSSVELLPAAERTVIEGHYFQQKAFIDLAEELRLTKGRVSQIHRAAVERLRGLLREQMIGFDG